MTYNPSQEDIDWALSVVGYIKDDGVWICDEGLCKVSHVLKTVTIQECRWPVDTVFWDKTEATFAAIGYTLHRSWK